MHVYCVCCVYMSVFLYIYLCVNKSVYEHLCLGICVSELVCVNMSGAYV